MGNRGINAHSHFTERLPIWESSEVPCKCQTASWRSASKMAEDLLVAILPTTLYSHTESTAYSA